MMLVTSFIVIIPIDKVVATDAYNDLNPTDDAVVTQEFPDANHGDGPSLRFRTCSGFQRYNFIKFDVSSIQPGITIKSAVLKFYWYAQSDGNAFGYTASAYRVTDDWDEHNVTWDNQPNYYPLATNTTTMPGSLGTWVSWDVTSDVQDFVDGAVINYGWRTEGNNFPGNTITDFYSKEYRDYFPEEPIGLQPCLEIEIADVYVDDDADPGWYDATHVKTIQEGINNASTGNTVFVYSGIYYENVVVDKTIKLIGENKDNTIIDGGGGDVVFVTANWVNTSGFTIQNGNDGINFHSDYNTISNTIFVSNRNGVIIATFRQDNIVINNIIDSNIQYAVVTDRADNNIIVGNSISNCGIRGIYLYHDSDGNHIYHNNIFSNTENARDEGSNNVWDDNYPSGGNYWDDYTGADGNGDGIGDTPYTFSGGQDNYPLMTKYGPPHADYNYIKNGRTVIFNASLSYDYNGEITSYEWVFGDGYTGTGMVISHTYTNYGTYIVTLEVTDDDGLTDEKSKDITLANNPPNQPSNPDPSDGETGVSVYAILSWTCSDPDGDELTYDVYFGTSSNPPLVSTGQSQTFYNPPGAMEYNTHYYWKIVAWDPYDTSTTGLIWDFTTTSEPNEPPELPSDPSPEDGATDVNVDTTLSWSCSDPDGDDLVYDVYFEANDPDPDVKVSDDQPENIYNPGTLKTETTYYWQIIAKDVHGASTPGPIWSFTTKKESINKPPSAPIINGPTSGKPGDYFSYTFVSVDPEGDNVYYQIDWGDGIVDDWFGPFESNEIQTMTHGWSFTGKFTISARAKDVNEAIGDWGTLEVNIQKNKAINTPFLNFLEDHPNLFLIIQKIIQRLGLQC
jgi:parallel beta-helix repeat protein